MIGTIAWLCFTVLYILHLVIFFSQQTLGTMKNACCICCLGKQSYFLSLRKDKYSVGQARTGIRNIKNHVQYSQLLLGFCYSVTSIAFVLDGDGQSQQSFCHASVFSVGKVQTTRAVHSNPGGVTFVCIVVADISCQLSFSTTKSTQQYVKLSSLFYSSFQAMREKSMDFFFCQKYASP